MDLNEENSSFETAQPPSKNQKPTKQISFGKNNNSFLNEKKSSPNNLSRLGTWTPNPPSIPSFSPKSALHQKWKIHVYFEGEQDIPSFQFLVLEFPHSNLYQLKQNATLIYRNLFPENPPLEIKRFKDSKGSYLDFSYPVGSVLQNDDFVFIEIESPSSISYQTPSFSEEYSNKTSRKRGFNQVSEAVSTSPFQSPIPHKKLKITHEPPKTYDEKEEESDNQQEKESISTPIQEQPQSNPEKILSKEIPNSTPTTPVTPTISSIPITTKEKESKLASKKEKSKKSQVKPSTPAKTPNSTSKLPQEKGNRVKNQKNDQIQVELPSNSSLQTTNQVTNKQKKEGTHKK